MLFKRLTFHMAFKDEAGPVHIEVHRADQDPKIAVIYEKSFSQGRAVIKISYNVHGNKTDSRGQAANWVQQIETDGQIIRRSTAGMPKQASTREANIV